MQCRAEHLLHTIQFLVDKYNWTVFVGKRVNLCPPCSLTRESLSRSEMATPGSWYSTEKADSISAVRPPGKHSLNSALSSKITVLWFRCSGTYLLRFSPQHALKVWNGNKKCWMWLYWGGFLRRIYCEKDSSFLAIKPVYFSWSQQLMSPTYRTSPRERYLGQLHTTLWLCHYED